MKFVVILLALTLSSCAAMKAGMSAMGLGGKGISVDAQIGDRANSANLGTSGVGKVSAKDGAVVTVNTSSKKGGVENAGEVTINECSYHLLYLLLIIVAVFVPQPPLRRWGKYLRSLFQKRR